MARTVAEGFDVLVSRIPPNEAPMLDLRPQPSATGAPSAAPGLE